MVSVYRIITIWEPSRCLHVGHTIVWPLESSLRGYGSLFLEVGRLLDPLYYCVTFMISQNNSCFLIGRTDVSDVNRIQSPLIPSPDEPQLYSSVVDFRIIIVDQYRWTDATTSLESCTVSHVKPTVDSRVIKDVVTKRWTSVHMYITLHPKGPTSVVLDWSRDRGIRWCMGSILQVERWGRVGTNPRSWWLYCYPWAPRLLPLCVPKSGPINSKLFIRKR